MGFYTEEIGQKQHLNLSDSAWAVVEEDMENFSDEGGDNNLSGFLNTIFVNFYESANASISMRLDEYKEKMATFLSGVQYKMLPEKAKRAFLDQLVHDKKEELATLLDTYVRGEGRKFRLNVQACEILADSEEDRFYDGKVGKYLKAIFEEYTLLPYDAREKIFFRETFDMIQKAIQKKCELKIELIDGKKIEFSPYKVAVEKAGTFHYLVGKQMGKYGKPRFVSYRLARLRSVRPLVSKKTLMTKDDVDKLQHLLLERGPQFLSGGTLEIKMRLTEQGYITYRRSIRGRPPIYGVEEGNIYVFHCTLSQALYYFYKFGPDATPVSPESVVQRFKSTLEASLASYEWKKEGSPWFAVEILLSYFSNCDLEKKRE